MRKLIAGAAAAALLTITVAAQSKTPLHTPPHAVAQPAVASHATGGLPVDAQNALVASSCSTCHDDEGKSGGLSLEHFDAAKIEQSAEVGEKLLRKLGARMMPPPSVTGGPPAP